MRRVHLNSVLTVLVLVACGSSEHPAGPDPVATISDLAGRWTLTAWEYSRAARTLPSIDWVETQELTGTLVIQRSGAFDLVITYPWDQSHDFGHLTVQGDAVYWDGEDDEELVPFVLDGTALQLQWPETELVDIDQDGQPEESWLRISMRRE